MDSLKKLIKKINDSHGIGLNIISIQLPDGKTHYYWEVNGVQGDLFADATEAIFDFLNNVDWTNDVLATGLSRLDIF